ncbi:MAG: type II toxin-antitoxin system VapC family toxin [Ignavibacteria bacterium]|nr:type II toxin-antitoxin system VapC family toxin [Ignavibacteria bacterium]
MNLLLDTHAFIWLVENDKQLSSKAKSIVEETSNANFISIASLWEIAIKVSLRKIKLQHSFEKTIAMINENGFELLNISTEHTMEASKLKFHHRDPFDRMLIAQAKVEKMTIVGKDEHFDKYKVKRIW